MNDQQRKTLSRSLFTLSGVIVLVMIGLGIFGTFNNASPSSPTPTQEQQMPDSQESAEPPATQEEDSGILGLIWNFIRSIWNFFGRVGLIAQLLCCIIVPLLILAGIVADKPL